MDIQLYLGTDIGAPTLTGTNGSLLGILDVLVNGYPTAGSAAVSSIASSGGVATVGFASAHGLSAGQKLQVAGCDQAAYNGKQTITIVDSTHVTFPVSGSPASPATGASITAVRAGLGWTKPYTGTNKAVYRAPAGNQRYLRILDDGSGTPGARQAFGIAYESMTGIDTGTNPFPSTTNSPGHAPVSTTNGSYWSKSVTLDSTARKWVLIGEDQLFYLFVEVNNSFPDRYMMMYFGDFVSLVSPASAYETIICNQAIALTTGSNPSLIDQIVMFGGFGTQIGSGNEPYCGVVARNISGAVGGVGHAFLPDTSINTSNNINSLGFLSNPINYPDPANGGLKCSAVRLQSSTPSSHERGFMPGLYMPHHNLPLAHLDLVTNIGGLTGRTLVAIRLCGNIAQSGSSLGSINYGLGQCLIDLTGPWR